jgi:hypothetical protein
VLVYEAGTALFASRWAGVATSLAEFTLLGLAAGTGGGYTSLAYEPYQVDGAYHPAMSYYDSTNSALKFARWDGSSWDATFVATQGVQGLYTSLVYDIGDRPSIFYFKKTNTTAYRAVKKGGSWDLTYLGTGGREVQAAKKSDGSVAYTNLDADGLRAGFLPF